MIEKTLRFGKGYTGKMGNKVWIARITGTNPKSNFEREFLEADKVEKEHFNRARTMVDLTWELEQGLYEASENGERWFFMVAPHKDGSEKSFGVTHDRTREMAKVMDDGLGFDEARKATKKPEA